MNKFGKNICTESSKPAFVLQPVTDSIPSSSPMQILLLYTIYNDLVPLECFEKELSFPMDLSLDII